MILTKELIDKYIKRALEIRKLSSAVFLTNGDDFSSKMQENFSRIGELASINKPILDEINILLADGYTLNNNDITLLMYLAESIIDPYSMENLDLMLEMRICLKLLSDAIDKNDTKYLIAELDKVITSSYAVMNMSKRVVSVSDMSLKFRDIGLKAAKVLYKYLEKENFIKLDMESKHLVLINARYSTALYESSKSIELFDEEYLYLKKSLDVAFDDFYRTESGNYDWDYHIMRAYQYFGLLEEPHKINWITSDKYVEIADHMEELKTLWESNRALYTEAIDEEELTLLHSRSMYYAGRITLEEFKETLLRIYAKKTFTSYELTNIFLNLLVPFEYIAVVDKEHISERDKLIITNFYRNILTYVYNFKNAGSLSYMLEYLFFILESFVEIPGGISYKEMCLECLASLHMPTFIHSVMVGKLAMCVGEYYYDSNKAIFDECFKDQTKNYVLNFINNAGLTHDFGKLPIIDTIFIYGRRLEEDEFMLIKAHPEMSYHLLKDYESTKKYAVIANNHHLFYDNSKGYPTNGLEDEYKIVTDIITIADCMDAATDIVGRSYSKGKTIEEFKEELIQGAGTRYNPDIVKLFENEKLINDLKFLLDVGRKETYKKSYSMLKSLQDEGKF